jgi:hypothetical protein
VALVGAMVEAKHQPTAVACEGRKSSWPQSTFEQWSQGQGTPCWWRGCGTVPKGLTFTQLRRCREGRLIFSCILVTARSRLDGVSYYTFAAFLVTVRLTVRVLAFIERTFVVFVVSA